MDQRLPLGKWPDIPPCAHQLMPVIREIASKQTDRIIWGNHFNERKDLRDTRSDGELNDKVALMVLRTGDIDGGDVGIKPGIDPGEWKAKVISGFNHEKGARNVGVVTIFLATHELFVKTIEWEDPT